MRTGALVLGIIGGAIAYFIGIAGFAFGQIAGAVEVEGVGTIKLLSIVVPTIGLVGASIVKSKMLLGGILMLVSAAAIFLLLGINVFSLLPGLPLALGGLLGVLAHTEVKNVAAE